MTCQCFPAHRLTFYFFAVVTFTCGVLFDVISGALRRGGVPMRLMSGAHAMVFGRLVRRAFRRLASAQSEHQHRAKQ